MFSVFKRIPLYIKISNNRIEIINLETGESVIEDAAEPFSTSRFIVADFHRAKNVIDSVLKNMFPKKGFLPQQRKIIIQQVEPAEGGLSEIEKRALRDLGEMAGGMPVVLVDHFRALSPGEALLEFEKK